MLNLIITNLKVNINIKKIVTIWLVTIILILSLTFAFDSFDEKYKKMQGINVAIVNNDTSHSTKMLIDSFQNTKHFSNLFKMSVLSLQEAKDKFKKSEIDSYVIIPAGFAKSLMRYENKKIEVYTNANNPTKNKLLSTTLKGYSTYVKTTDIATYILNNLMSKENFSNDKLKKLNTSFTFDLLLATIGRAGYFTIKTSSLLPSSNSKDYYMAVVPISLITFLAVAYALSYIERKEKLLYKRLSLCKISKLGINIAEFIGLLLTLTLIFMPYYILLFIKTGIETTMYTTLALTLTFLLFTYIWKTLFILINDKNLSLLISLISAFFISLFSGGIVPFILLPNWCKNIAIHTFNFKSAKFILGAKNYMDICYMLLSLLAFVILKSLLENQLDKRRA